MAELSVIIPAYNAEKFLQKCVASVTKQTFKDTEIILVDDGSTDQSGQICDRLAQKDSRIVVIHQKNQGSIAARRNGLERANSAYVCFCDADDGMPPRALELLVDQLKRSGGDICTGNSVRAYRGFHLKTFVPPCLNIQSPTVYEREQIFSELYISWFGKSNVPVSLCAKVYKTEILKEAYHATPDLGIFLGDDLIVTLAAFSLAQRVSFIPDTVYFYTIGGGTSTFRPGMMDEWITLYNYKLPFAEKYIPNSDARRYADIELCNMTFTYFDMLLDKGHLSRDQFIAEVSKTISRPEIQTASQDPLIDTQRSVNVRLLREGNAEAIYDVVRQRLDSTALRRKFKAFLNKL